MWWNRQKIDTLQQECDNWRFEASTRERHAQELFLKANGWTPVVSDSTYFVTLTWQPPATLDVKNLHFEDAFELQRSHCSSKVRY